MKTDPEQIRVAIRVNESVNVTRGSAQIAMGYTADDNSISEKHEFDVQLTGTQTLTPKLTRGLQPGELVTVMSLSPEDARTMRDFQQRLYHYDKSGGDGDGSFTLRLQELCLDKDLPAGDIPLTLFLKTEENEDYVVFIKSTLRDLFTDTDSDLNALPFCEDVAQHVISKSTVRLIVSTPHLPTS